MTSEDVNVFGAAVFVIMCCSVWCFLLLLGIRSDVKATRRATEDLAVREAANEAQVALRPRVRGMM